MNSCSELKVAFAAASSKTDNTVITSDCWALIIQFQNVPHCRRFSCLLTS